MRLLAHIARAVWIAAVIGACSLALPSAARAQSNVEPEAQAVLAAMSRYLGGLSSFSLEFSAVDEIVTAGGEKLQFIHSGDVLLQRPDRFYSLRRGAAGTAEIFLAGGTLSLFGRSANAYLQVPAASIDAAINAVRSMGFDVPGADFIASNPFAVSATDLVSGNHVGMTFIDGVEVHHLAFRGTDVDWQLWVTAGDRPLPVRLVVTTKAVTGAPQFTLQVRNWDVAPQIDAARFAFSPPQGARTVDRASVTVNAVGDMNLGTP